MAFSSKILSWVDQPYHRSGLDGRWLAFCELDREGPIFIWKRDPHSPDGHSKIGCQKTLYLLPKPDDLGYHSLLFGGRHMDGLNFGSYPGIDLPGGNPDLYQTCRRKGTGAEIRS